MVVACQMTFENKLESCHFGNTWLGIIYCASENYGNKLAQMVEITRANCKQANPNSGV